MKRPWIAFVLAVACSREPASSTATIAPAAPRPSPTLTDTIGSKGLVTTSGSPAPASAIAPGTEVITIDRDGFGVRPLLPRTHTVFHIRNGTDLAHDLMLRGPTGSAVATVAPSSETVLQLLLRDGEYELICTTAGHTERVRFKTYAPGRPLR